MGAGCRAHGGKSQVGQWKLTTLGITNIEIKTLEVLKASDVFIVSYVVFLFSGNYYQRRNAFFTIPAVLSHTLQHVWRSAYPDTRCANSLS